MSSKYEKEIEEILKNLGAEPPRKIPKRRRGWWQGWTQRFQDALMRQRWGISPGQLMLTSFALIIASYFLRFIVPVWGRYIGAAGVILFLIAFGWSIFRSGERTPEKRWRGQVIDYRSYRRGSWREWLDRLLGRRRRY